MNVVYVGLFLTEESRSKLKRAIENITDLYDLVYIDHVTIKFKPTEVEMESYKDFLGKTYKIHGVGFIEDDNAQVLVVKLPEEIEMDSSQKAHITIATKKGIKPVYSNTLLFAGKNPQTKMNLELEGIFDTFPRTAE